MIEIILMLLGMAGIGYSFYRNSRTLSEIKDARISPAWKISIKVAAAFILFTFFVFSLVFFDFVSLNAMGQDFLKIMLGFVFLASSLVVTLVVMVNSAGVRNIKRMYEESSKEKEGLERKVSGMEKELRNAESKGMKETGVKIKELQRELEDMKKITRYAVGRELKMVELKKEIKRLEEQSGQK